MMLDLYNHSLLTIFLVGFAAIVTAIEIGRWLGVRAGGKDDTNVPTLEGAVLGLVALIVGFTFAMSLSRFEARRDAVLGEANAIGTTALRARLLPEPHRKEVLGFLRDYTKIRLDVAQTGLSGDELAAAVNKSNVLQEKLWQQAAIIAAADNSMVPTGLFIQSLNETIDDQAKRLAALRNRVPNIVQLALFAIAVIATGFAGYAAGLQIRRSRVPVYVTGLLINIVILLILDLDRPGAGFIEVSQQPMIDAASAIDAFFK
jgi:CDP-diglyceride synthetase